MFAHKIKKVFTVVVLLVLIIFIILYAWQQQATKSKTENETSNVSLVVVYVCDNSKTISAMFREDIRVGTIQSGQPTPRGNVNLELSDGRHMSLLKTKSAEGVRYTNTDESFVFWTTGNRAGVLEGGVEKDYVGCVKE